MNCRSGIVPIASVDSTAHRNRRGEQVIETIERPDFAFRDVLLSGINTYNAMHGFPDNSRTVAFFPSGSGTPEASGGALGYFIYGTLYIDLIYVPDSSRRLGTGRSLLLEALVC